MQSHQFEFTYPGLLNLEWIFFSAHTFNADKLKYIQRLLGFLWPVMLVFKQFETYMCLVLYQNCTNNLYNRNAIFLVLTISSYPSNNTGIWERAYYTLNHRPLLPTTNCCSMNKRSNIWTYRYSQTKVAKVTFL